MRSSKKRFSPISHPLREGWRPIAGLLRRFRRDQSGAAIVLAAVLFPVVIGGLGLGAETGYWYLTQRKLQHAADVAAHAAGIRKRAGDGHDKFEAAALEVATETGFLASSGGTLVANSPPASGPNSSDSNSVEVLISEVHPRLFSSIFSSDPLTLRSRAVAKLSGGSAACVLALSPTASGAVNVSGSTSINLSGCDVASNSNAADSFLMSGSTGSLTADCAFAVGEAVTTTSLTLNKCPEVKEYASPVVDPYASVPEPDVSGTCKNKNVGSPNSSTTLTPTENHSSGMKVMRFCNGMDIKGNVSFSPGLYIIESGDFTVNSGDLSSASAASLVGSDVTFYLTNGARLKIGGNATMQLSAPTSGPYSGILFFGSRTETAITHQLSGTSGTALQGAIYTPASPLSFKGNSSTGGGCTQIVASTVTFTGNSSLDSSCDAAGTQDIVTNQVVSIVE